MRILQLGVLRVAGDPEVEDEGGCCIAVPVTDMDGFMSRAAQE